MIVELTRRDLKEGAEIRHMLLELHSQQRLAAAWGARSTTSSADRTIGQVGPLDHAAVARTVRTRLVAVPGRLVNIAGP